MSNKIQVKTLLFVLVIFFFWCDALLAESDCEKEGWHPGPVLTLPPLRVVDSARKNAKLDIVLDASIGGGIEYKQVVKDSEGKFRKRIAVSAIVLFSGSTDDNKPPVNFAIAGIVSFLDGLLVAGIGFDFGDNVVQTEDGLDYTRNRSFFLLGLGTMVLR
jgi:hypothetical protein